MTVDGKLVWRPERRSELRWRGNVNVQISCVLNGLMSSAVWIARGYMGGPELEMAQLS